MGYSRIEKVALVRALVVAYRGDPGAFRSFFRAFGVEPPPTPPEGFLELMLLRRRDEGPALREFETALLTLSDADLDELADALGVDADEVLRLALPALPARRRASLERGIVELKGAGAEIDRVVAELERQLDAGDSPEAADIERDILVLREVAAPTLQEACVDLERGAAGQLTAVEVAARLAVHDGVFGRLPRALRSPSALNAAGLALQAISVAVQLMSR